MGYDRNLKISKTVSLVTGDDVKNHAHILTEDRSLEPLDRL